MILKFGSLINDELGSLGKPKNSQFSQNFMELGLSDVIVDVFAIWFTCYFCEITKANVTLYQTNEYNDICIECILSNPSILFPSCSSTSPWLFGVFIFWLVEQDDPCPKKQCC